MANPLKVLTALSASAGAAVSGSTGLTIQQGGITVSSGNIIATSAQLSASAVSASGNAQFGGTLTVVGASSLQALTASAGAVVSGSSGLTVQQGGITVSNGATSVQALSASDGAVVSGSSGLTVQQGGITVSNGNTSLQALTASAGVQVSGSTGLTVQQGGITVSNGNINASSSQLTASAITASGNAQFGGTLTVGGITALQGITATTVSASSTGQFGGNLTTVGNLTVGSDNTTNSTITLKNNHATYFSVDQTGSARFEGDVSIGGTLSVQTINYQSSSAITLGDKFIIIASGAADHTSLNGSGILLGSGATGASVDEYGANAHILYRSSIDKLEIFPGISSSAITGTELHIHGTGSQVLFNGDLAVDGISSLNGNVNLGNSAADNVVVYGHLTASNGVLFDVSGGDKFIVGDASGPIVIQSLNVTNTKVTSITPLDVLDTLTVKNSMEVELAHINGTTGEISSSGNLKIAGTSTLQAVTASSVTASGNAQFGGTLTVSGNTTLVGSLTVSGSAINLGNDATDVVTVAGPLTASSAISTTAINGVYVGDRSASAATVVGAEALNHDFGPYGSNTAIGYRALSGSASGVTSGSVNTAIGASALRTNVSGNSNVAVGSSALELNNSGSNNVAIGNTTLSQNNGGSFNVAIGNNALYQSKGDRNIAIGYTAGMFLGDVSGNVILGSYTANAYSSVNDHMFFADGDGNLRFLIDNSGKTTFSGSVDVKGAVSASAITASGNAQFGGTLTVGGTTSLQALTASAGAVVSGSTGLTVQQGGITVSNGNIAASNSQLSASAVSASGNAQFGGTLTVGGNLVISTQGQSFTYLTGSVSSGSVTMASALKDIDTAISNAVGGVVGDLVSPSEYYGVRQALTGNIDTAGADLLFLLSGSTVVDGANAVTGSTISGLTASSEADLLDKLAFASFDVAVKTSGSSTWTNDLVSVQVAAQQVGATYFPLFTVSAPSLAANSTIRLIVVNEKNGIIT